MARGRGGYHTAIGFDNHIRLGTGASVRFTSPTLHGHPESALVPRDGRRIHVGREPGSRGGEMLVKLEASGLNPLPVRIQKSGFTQIREYCYSERGRGLRRKSVKESPT